MFERIGHGAAGANLQIGDMNVGLPTLPANVRSWG
jgi:hypothetical protein